MIYSKFYVKNEKFKVPVPFAALVFLVASFVFGRFFLTNTTRYSKAFKNEIKQNIVTNYSPYQANIFWQSHKPGKGFLLYGEEKNRISTVVVDDRDLNDEKKDYLNHYMTLKGLFPGKTYYYKIVFEEKIIDSNGEPFVFKTPTQPPSNTGLSPANGKVLKKSLAGLNGGLLLFEIEGVKPLSTVTKSTGEWLIPLNTFYDEKSLQPLTMSSSQKAKITIYDEQGEITFIEGKLMEMTPIKETLVIGKTYRLNSADGLVLAARSKQTSFGEIDIVYPLENALIPGLRPLVKGTALPNFAVKITIDSSKTFSSVVKANHEGLWSYSIPEDLGLGKCSLSISSDNRDGKTVYVNRTFTIVSNDHEGKVLGESSQSATITPLPTTILTITPSPTFILYNQNITPTALQRAGVEEKLPIIGGLSFVIAGIGLLLVF